MTTINLNQDWRFCLAESENYPGPNLSDAFKVHYDESNWRKLDLPHDWSIEFDFNIEGSLVGSEAGYLDGGEGWYRKKLILPKEVADQRFFIHFGGVYMDSTVYVNGELVGKYPNGYMPFTYDITQYLKADGVSENVIAVKVVNRQPSSRWYSGSGIYRDVTLSMKDAVHIAEYGTFVTTPDLETEYETGKVTAHVATEVCNTKSEAVSLCVRTTVLSYEEGTPLIVPVVSEQFIVEAGDTYTTQQRVKITEPKLWGVGTPNLYTVRTEVMVAGEVVDCHETRWGMRWVKFDANTGFWLNGEWMKLKGVCMHHDQGALGAVANPRALARQMEIMQEMGVNAIRVTHNPAADDLLRICDEMGLMVIDEAFDTWYWGKKQYDLGRFFAQGSSSHPEGADKVTWAEFDLKRMIKRGRNFPGIIKWSVGNEVCEADGDPRSLETIKNLKKWAGEVDPTRGITQGADKFRFGSGEGGHEHIAMHQDTVGFNYAEANYDAIHAKHPDWALYGSETSSATKSRGIYAHPDRMGVHDSGDHEDFQQSSYDNDHVGWGKSASNAWIDDRDRYYIAGQFIWTGFDYIGEPTPWHNTGGPGHELSPKSSYFGIVDTAGLPKDDYFLYQSVWKSVATSPMVHILPHWNWEDEALRSKVLGEDGKIPVRVYSNAPHVELFMDGVSLGKQSFAQKVTNYGLSYQQQSETSDRLYQEWRLAYAYKPGTTLTAVATDDAGQVVAQEAIVTAGTPAAVALTADRPVIQSDGVDLCYITVAIQDAAGHFVPTAETEVHFELVGDGQIVGVDNGNPISHERYKAQADGSWKRKAFSGKAIVIVQASSEEGQFTLHAKADGLRGAGVTIYTTAQQTAAEVLGYTPIEVMTTVGEPPILPETVEAICADGTCAVHPVKWAPYTMKAVKSCGSFELKGTVETTGQEVYVVVVVQEVLAGQLEAIAVNGTLLEGFAQERYAYTLPVAYGEQIPEVSVVTAPSEDYYVTKVPMGRYAKEVMVTMHHRVTGEMTSYSIRMDVAAPKLQAVVLETAEAVIREDEKMPLIVKLVREDGSQVPARQVSVSYAVTSIDGGEIEIVEGMIYGFTKGHVHLSAQVSFDGEVLTGNTLALEVLPTAHARVIEAYEPVEITVGVGEAPVLPSHIKAYFKVGFPRLVAVRWEAMDEAAYDQVGRVMVAGEVSGAALKVNGVVIVRCVVGVQAVTTATVQGIPASLPEKVRVYLSDGKQEEHSVNWLQASHHVASVGMAEVTGHIPVLDQKCQAAIRVVAQPEEMQISENYAKQWTGSQLPAALASFTNDGVYSRDRIECVNDTIISFDETTHNRWSNWQATPRQQEWVGILFAEGGNMTQRYLDTIKVGFYQDHEIGAPSELRVAYYVPSEEPAVPARFGHVTEGALAEDGNWCEIPYTVAAGGIEVGEMCTLSFEMIHTYAIRLVMTVAPALKGIGITELEAYGKKAVMQNTYTVQYITLNGEDQLEAFDEMNCLSYTYSGEDFPEVTVGVSHHACVTIAQATVANGQTRIEVVPENGDVSQMKVYTITYTKA